MLNLFHAMQTFRRNTSLYSVALLFILFAGCAVRFYDLSGTPPRLSADEVMHANQAWAWTAHGHGRLYYKSNAQFGLLSWLLSLPMSLLGDTTFALRSTMAFFGCATLIGSYALALELWRFHARRQWIALACVYLAGSSLWLINFSRIIFSASLVPCLEVFILLATLMAIRRKSMGLYAAAGIICAAGLFSYWQFYSFLLLPLMLIVHNAWKEKHWRGASLFFVIFLLLGLVPLTYASWHYRVFHHPGFLFRHYYPADKSPLSFILNVAQSGLLTLGAFFFDGDSNWRHNYNSEAELSFLAQIGLVATIIYAGGLGMKKRHVSSIRPLALAAAWLLLAMAPAIMVPQGVPHAERGIGMAVPALLLAGFGLYRLTMLVILALKHAGRNRRFIRQALLCGLTVIAAGQFANTAYKYLVTWGNSPELDPVFHTMDCTDHPYCIDGRPATK